MAVDSAMCPCGNDRRYEDCCQPVHQGQATRTADALMRARFSAYVLHDNEFLLASWHPQTRPAHIDAAQGPQWKRLQILDHRSDGEQATVLFEATGCATGQWFVLQEQSRFLRDEEHWRYHSGDVSEQSLTPGRNDPCPCGSGRKFKRCCLGS